MLDETTIVGNQSRHIMMSPGSYNIMTANNSSIDTEMPQRDFVVNFDKVLASQNMRDKKEMSKLVNQFQENQYQEKQEILVQGKKSHPKITLSKLTSPLDDNNSSPDEAEEDLLIEKVFHKACSMTDERFTEEKNRPQRFPSPKMRRSSQKFKHHWSSQRREQEIL